MGPLERLVAGLMALTVLVAVLAAVLVAALATQAMAQSGVVSGPPQVKVEPIWIAVAGGFDGNGRNVGVGYSGQRNTRQEAETAALNACRGQARGVRCQEAHASNAGCLYIVPGSRRGGVTWGRGSTADVALSECRRGGYTCNSNRVIGGCVPGAGN